jgi:hypothetical protein
MDDDSDITDALRLAKTSAPTGDPSADAMQRVLLSGAVSPQPKPYDLGRQIQEGIQAAKDLYGSYKGNVTEANRSAADLQRLAVENMRSGSPGRMLLGAGQDILAPVAGVMAPLTGGLETTRQGVEYRLGAGPANAFEVASNILQGPEDIVNAARMAAKSAPTVAHAADIAPAMAMTMLPARKATETAVAEVPSKTTEAAAVETAKRELTPLGFYSRGAEAAKEIPQAKGSAEQMVGMLRKQPGVSEHELINAGILTDEGKLHPEFASRGTISREDLASHLQSSMPQVQETVLNDVKQKKIKEINDRFRSIKSQLEKEEPGSLEHDYLTSQIHGLTDEMSKIYDTMPSGNQSKFGEYTLPGGENYREVLLRLTPEMRNVTLDEVNAQRQKISSMLPLMTQDEYNTALASGDIAKIEKNPNAINFKSQHWDDPNVLAHLRMADRTGPNGEKILHVEEVQSDWGQKGKKEGFDTPKMRSKLLKELPEGYVVKPSDYQRTGGAERYSVFDPNGVEVGTGYGRENAINSTLNDLNTQIRGTSASLVPSAPYVTSTPGWTDLAMKRILKEAAEGGYDKLVWTPGEEQAKRYDLSKQIDRLEYIPTSKELIGVKNNQGVFHKTIEPNEIENYAGKEIAKNLLAQPIQGEEYVFGGFHALSGQDLSVGGEGMKEYYDKIFPKRLQTVAQKHDKNAKVGQSLIKTHGDEWPFSARIAHDGENYWVAGKDPRTNDSGEKSLSPKYKSYEEADRHRNLLYQGFNQPVNSLDITPQMRESILRGQGAYKKGGRVGYATNGAVQYDSIELPNSLKELQNWAKTHPAQLTRNSMDNVFTNRISTLEGEKPIAMPANLRELQDWDRISHDHALNLARKLYDSED